MDNRNSLLYFVSQAYRQVQLSVEKGSEPYPYSAFNGQFQELLEASGDAEYTKSLTILLVEEAARLKQTTDYLRQEMAFEIKSSATSHQPSASEYIESDFGADRQADLYSRRMERNAR
ncbi:hypothetical protein [Spirosoma sp.]|uniref:hypothetical protein n=1 Tax=Spirosoma sp. TaxID=1899569 RepID=UPI003B3AD091